MGRAIRLAVAGAVVVCAVLAVIALRADGTPDDVVGSASAGLRLVKVGTFDQPVYVTAPPGDRRRLFVVERAGRIRVLRDGRVHTFLDIRSKVESGYNEQGLLSMAFAPDYARTKRFYVYYTDRSGDQRIVEYTRRTPRTVLVMADHEDNHNGGLLLFGPDGKLYVGTGDGGGSGDRHGARGNAQDPSSLLGKILRMDPRSPARPEIYAYGLRNPWRFSFDRRTHDLTIGDVGQERYEEVDFLKAGTPAGTNFGWRVFEGFSRYTPGEAAPGAVKPRLVLRHSDGNCSITGGVVVRDRHLKAEYGRYLFADFCAGKVLSVKLRASGPERVRSTGLRVGSPSSFGEDPRGRVYVVSLQGPVYRVAAR